MIHLILKRFSVVITIQVSWIPICSNSQRQKIIIPAKNLSKAEAKALKQQENNLNELE